MESENFPIFFEFPDYEENFMMKMGSIKNLMRMINDLMETEYTSVKWQ